MSKGIDVSHNVIVTDWNKIKAAGIDFVMIRSSHGTAEDREFKNYMKGAAAVGLPIGIWHFSYAATVAQAEAEAEKCLSLIKPYKIDLPVYWDFEIYAEKKANPKVVYTKDLRDNMAITFCEKIKSAGYMPGIYTNLDYILYRYNWDKQLKGKYKLWLARWLKDENTVITYADVNSNNVTTKYGAPAIWQIGLGNISGVGNVDINYGYMPLPVKATETIATPATVTTAAFKAGDVVSVAKYTKLLGIKRGKTYEGGTFRIYYDSYDVISVSGKRVVIGRGKAVTAAVNADDLKKV